MAKRKKTTLPSSLIVTQANQLVEARYSLPLAEQRLILMMLSKIQPNDDDFKEYRISINEFAEFMGINKNHVYAECRKTTKKMLSRVLEIQETGRLLQANWVSSADYVDGEGCVKLCFDPKLKPYLLQLKSNFTSCRLEMLLGFKSQYTMRIYTLLKQYEKLKEREFDLIQLREILGLRQDQHTEYSNFKNNVLKITQKELSEKADLYFDFQEIKYGRKVGAIRFNIFTRKLPNAVESEQISLFDELSYTTATDTASIPLINASKTSPSDELLNLIPEPHRSKKTVLAGIKDYLKKHGYDYVKHNILYSNAKAGKSYAGFFANALKEDWGHDWQLDQQHSDRVANESSVVQTKVLDVWERQGFSSEKDYAQFMFDKQMADFAKHNQKTDTAIQQTNSPISPIVECFLALPIEQQDKLRDLFMKGADSIVRAKMKSSLQKGEAFYKSPLVSGSFKLFLKENLI